MKEIEATVVKREIAYGNLFVEISPSIGTYLILSSASDNYPEFSNKLYEGNTFIFYYKEPGAFSTYFYPRIKYLEEPKMKATTSRILGHKNILQEFPILDTHPHQLLLQDSKHRLLISDKKLKEIKTNKIYIIQFQKSFGLDLYKVKKLTMLNDQDLHLKTSI